MVVLAACRGTPAPTQPPETIEIAGSAALSPLLSEMAAGFQTLQPGVTVRITPGNSYGGLQAVLDGQADLGALAAVPPVGVWSAPLALDGVAIVVHPDNPLSDLTLVQLRQILSGQVWHWRDLGIDLDEIVVVSREAGSGARLAVEGVLLGESCRPALILDGRRAGVTDCDSPVTSTAVVMPDSESVLAFVGAHREAIGYVSQGLVTEQVKVVRLEGLLPAPAELRDGGYPIVEPFVLVAGQEPTGMARKFVDFCLGRTGQEITARRYATLH